MLDLSVADLALQWVIVNSYFGKLMSELFLVITELLAIYMVSHLWISLYFNNFYNLIRRNFYICSKLGRNYFICMDFLNKNLFIIIGLK